MPSRRTVITGALAASASLRAIAQAQNPLAGGPGGDTAPRTILQLQRRNIEVNGKPASVYGIQQPDGTFGITTDVGKPFRVRVENRIGQPSLIHWHGLAPPWQQDAAPGISGPPIPAGGTADYDFPLGYGGTFYMHSHQGLQEQLLMVAPLIIHDERYQPGVQEIVIMLGDFSFTPPEQIFEDLRKRSSMPQMAGASQRAVTMAEMAQRGPGAPRDLNDVKYDAFLANYRTLADPEVVKVEPGGEALLRIINASSMTNFHLELGQLQGRLIAVDGFSIVPQIGQRFPITTAQRLDIGLSLPRGPGAYPILAVVEGERKQTGIVLSAGSTQIARVPETTERPSAALTLDFERSLRAAKPLRPRKPDRVHTINLTGEMVGYIWSLNNIVWKKDVPPLPVAAGDRIELDMINRTGMSHPMHLHGHQFRVVEIDGKRLPGAVRDVVLVPPGRRVAVVFDANNPVSGPSIAICSTTWKPACSRLFVTSSRPLGRRSEPFRRFIGRVCARFPDRVASGASGTRRRDSHVSASCDRKLRLRSNRNFSAWVCSNHSGKCSRGRDYRRRFYRRGRNHQTGRRHHRQRYRRQHFDSWGHR